MDLETDVYTKDDMEPVEDGWKGKTKRIGTWFCFQECGIYLYIKHIYCKVLVNGYLTYKIQTTQQAGSTPFLTEGTRSQGTPYNTDSTPCYYVSSEVGCPRAFSCFPMRQ